MAPKSQRSAGKKVEVLRETDLGAPVAEKDDKLLSHFIKTDTLRGVATGQYDVILGLKGSGKSAILKIVRDAKESLIDDFPLLKSVRMIEASNQEHLGNPVFRNVFEEFQTRKVDLTHYQPQLIDAWKVYVLSIIWNEIGEEIEDGVDKDLLSIWKRLVNVKGDLLSQMRFAFARVLYFNAIETQVSAEGTFSGRVEFPDKPPESQTYIPFAEIFLEINRSLAENGLVTWVLFDRLDEAFPGNEALEKAGIRSILNAYKDLSSLSNISLKISLREDLLQRATSEGFRAMTHIRPRMSPTIRWDDADLLALIVKRFIDNDAIKTHFAIDEGDLSTDSDFEQFFYRLVPPKVNPGNRKSVTWIWVRNRVRDGQDVKTPRDVVAFFNELKGVQIHEWEREEEPAEPYPLFETTSFAKALSAFSKMKYNDHLLAENPDLYTLFEAFREQKAEHSPATLKTLFSDEWQASADKLVKVGFLKREATKEGLIWKVPMVYRPALSVSQGAAIEDDS